MKPGDEWTEPTDESPIKTPDGWEGGEVVHTGGGIYARRWFWRNEGGEIEYVVGYGPTAGFDGASVERWDDYEAGEFGGVVDSEPADDQTDSGCAEVARKLINEYP